MERSGPRLRANRRKQEILLALLREICEEKGLRQVDVAAALTCPQTVVRVFDDAVGLLETGEGKPLSKRRDRN